MIISGGMKVTFDTNSLDRAARPERHPKDSRQCDFLKVREAIVAGRIKGYFSETIVTLEGIERKDRIGVMSSSHFDEHRQETVDQDTGRVTISLTLTTRQNRHLIHPEHTARIQAALKVGLRALKGPSRVGWILIQDPDESFFAPDADAAFADRMDRTNNSCSEIEARGLGFAQVKSLAKSFASREQADIIRRQEQEFVSLDQMLAPPGLRAPKIHFEEPWFTSLLRAKAWTRNTRYSERSRSGRMRTASPPISATASTCSAQKTKVKALVRHQFSTRTIAPGWRRRTELNSSPFPTSQD